ncbi:DNA-3-methyladenine glycosylase family protein [Cellulomonas soli]|uniref:DNA-3-methyladenine glycosylase family protein n=1 Tax=Cellulomonas soli TaxID=931535 RepID=UPI003F8507E4
MGIEHRESDASADVRAAAPDRGGPFSEDVEVPVRHPFDAPGVFRFLAVRAVRGVEVADLTRPDELRYARTLSLPAGPAAVEVVATHHPGRGWDVRAHLELASAEDLGPCVGSVRRMLGLDTDPVAVDTALAADPALAPLVARTPGIRVPGAVDPHELVVRALVGQQISVAAARTHLGRLAAHAGSPHASGVPGLGRLFPTPEQIVRTVPEPAPGEPLDPGRPVRLPGAAVRALLATCRALAAGDLAVHAEVDPDELRARLVARPRIGPWTAAYVAMRVLGDPDAWLERDVALLAGARAIGVLDVDLPTSAAHRVLARRAAAWAPWRSYAAMHLWQAAVDSPSPAVRQDPEQPPATVPGSDPGGDLTA